MGKTHERSRNSGVPIPLRAVPAICNNGFQVANRRSNWLAYLQTGMEMTVAVFIGFTAGYFADKKLGAGPWLLFTGSALGVAAAILIAFQAVSQAGEELKNK